MFMAFFSTRFAYRSPTDRRRPGFASQTVHSKPIVNASDRLVLRFRQPFQSVPLVLIFGVPRQLVQFAPQLRKTDLHPPFLCAQPPAVFLRASVCHSLALSRQGLTPPLQIPTSPSAVSPPKVLAVLQQQMSISTILTFSAPFLYTLHKNQVRPGRSAAAGLGPAACV